MSVSERPRSQPSSSNVRGHLEVSLGKRPPITHPLTSSHVIVGRSPKAQLTLDHTTVSRRHAELFFDPFGRWWIRDLASTNGTRVNGEAVMERILNPGDLIAIGDFSLRFMLPSRRKRTDSGIPFAPKTERSKEYDSLTSIRVLSDAGESPKIGASQLSSVMDLSKRMLAIGENNARLAALCEVMVGKDFPADAAFAMRLRPKAPPKMLSGIYRRVPLSRPRAPYISQRVLQTISETKAAVLASNLPTGRASMELTMSGAVQQLAVIACPLDMDDDGRLDLLYVKVPPKYGTVEWLSLLSLVAEAYQQAESTWSARRHAQAHAAVEQELDMARTIQQGLVPTSPEGPGLDVAIGFEPCKWVGGDYVDSLTMGDGRVLLFVADVCGKGLQAALITASLHTMVHTSPSSDGLAALMDRMNDYLCDYLPDTSFVTMVAVAFDPSTGALECVNAGHPPPLVVNPQGQLRQLQCEENPALGMVPVPMVAEQSQLAPGEVLLLYTDGLTELRNMNREMLGLERLGEGLVRLCGESSQSTCEELSKGLGRLLDQYRGKRLPEDDRAFLLAKRDNSHLRRLP